MISLREWLLQNQVYLDERLGIDQQSSPSSNTRVVSTRGSIPPNETVARIPKSLILSRKTSTLSRLVITQQPSDYLVSLSPALQLSIHVLYELSLGTRSKWYGYFENYPREIVDIALLWESESRARRWIVGTELEKDVQRIAIDREVLTRLFDSFVQPLFSSLPPPSPSTTRLVTAERFFYAYSLVSSRCFRIDNNYHLVALVPLADAFNHLNPPDNHVELVCGEHDWVCQTCGKSEECIHDDSNIETQGQVIASIHSQEEEEEESIDMVTTRTTPTESGEELFNSYGSGLGNSRLIAEYGFKLEANEWDSISFDMELVLQAMRESGSVVSAPARREVENESRRNQIRAEEEHPLIATSTSATTEDSRSPLHIDADAKLSRMLWETLVDLIGLDAGRRNQVLKVSALVWEEEEEETIHGEISSLDRQSLGKIARVIGQLCEAKLKAQYQPHLTGTELLDLAEVEFDERLKLAIEFAAGERLLLERVKENWRFAYNNLDKVS